MKKLNRLVLATITMFLFFVGGLMILGELEEFNIINFIFMKILGITIFYVGYLVWDKHFKDNEY